ncbi:MAG: FAD:protein FMN transferase, partial [Elusimicrobiales bacterium]|nr:FAD:protein FMN transferase [Elusimicrobiales bacterium]
MLLERKMALLAAALALLAGCARKKEEAAYLQTGFVMSTQAHVKVYGAPPEEGKRIADAVFAEWKRVDDEYSFGSPYGSVAHVNGKAYGEWVRVDDEFLALLAKSMEYFRLTDGAFDITFAPLWPIWKEAASSRKMPPKEEIARALSSMGSRHIMVDHPRKLVRFLKPVQINMGGVLRGYCMERGRLALERTAGAYPVELKLGGNILAYGKRDWSYSAPDPFHEGGSLGSFRFDEGFIMYSSGRD